MGKVVEAFLFHTFFNKHFNGGNREVSLIFLHLGPIFLIILSFSLLRTFGETVGREDNKLYMFEK